MKKLAREYDRFPEACIERGISRPVAYRLVQVGALATFRLGRTRYVYLDSLETLPERADEVSQLLRKLDEQRASA